jgi:hypothetical protein
MNLFDRFRAKDARHELPDLTEPMSVPVQPREPRTVKGFVQPPTVGTGSLEDARREAARQARIASRGVRRRKAKKASAKPAKVVKKAARPVKAPPSAPRRITQESNGIVHGEVLRTWHVLTCACGVKFYGDPIDGAGSREAHRVAAFAEEAGDEGNDAHDEEA